MLKTIRYACLMALMIVVFSSTAPAATAQDQRPPPAPIRLQAGTFTPTEGQLPDIPQTLTAHPVEPGQHGYYIVQFAGPVQQDWKDAVEAQGAELLGYIPDFAFKVRMNPAQAARVGQLDSVVWVGPFQPAYKLSRDLQLDGPHLYRVLVERGGDFGLARAAIARSGAQVLSHDGDILLVGADAAQVQAIARVVDVAWVENYVLRETNNEYGAGQIVGSDIANGAGYDGSTQIVAVADTGLGGGTAATAHPDIPASRITAIYDWPGAAGGCFQAVVNDGARDVDSGHGTHTSGSVLSDGGPSGEGRGAAPSAHLIFQSVEDWADSQSGLCSFFYPDGYYLLGLPDDLHELYQQAFDDGARVHSNSWGSAQAGVYTLDSANTDDFIWNNPDMTITFSAGNAGVDDNADGLVDSDSMGSPGTAKNVITVGASEGDRQGHYECDTGLTYGTCGGNQVSSLGTWGSLWPSDFPANPLASDVSAGNAMQLAAFSSRGPTDDGRIKPDVVAPGTWILSTYSDLYQESYDPSPNPQNGAYQYDGWGMPLSSTYKYMGGTSMANPIVAGAAAVVRDFYQKTDSHNASAALVKATLINSAVDLLDENNDGANDNDYPIPNVHEGWGRINLDNATAGSADYYDVMSGLSTGGIDTYPTTVSVTGAPLRITLVWSDYPSTEAAAANLVNDLDLTVTAPDGTTVYRGNVFSGGWSQTGGTNDRVNNVENVYIQTAAAGNWTVAVSGYNVPSGPQPYAIVIDGSGVSTTPITLATFKASQQGSLNYIQWSTATELANLGFNLYVETAEGRVRLNDDPIPSQAVDSVAPLHYSFVTSDPGGEVFYLEDVSIFNETRLHGPFTLGETYGEREESAPVDWDAIQAEHDAKVAQREAVASAAAGQLSEEAQAALEQVADGVAPAAESTPVPTPTPTAPEADAAPGAAVTPPPAEGFGRQILHLLFGDPDTFRKGNADRAEAATPTELLAPPDGATDLAVPVTFEWTDGEGVRAYQFALYEDDKRIYRERQLDPAEICAAGLCQWTPEVDYSPEAVYSWQLTVRYERGGKDQMDPWTFHVAGDSEEPAATETPTATPEPSEEERIAALSAAVANLEFPVMELRVAADGLYRASYADLLDAGLDLNNVPAENIGLLNQGAPVPVYVDGGEIFGPDSAIEFYGEALDTLYTDTNVYWLVVSSDYARPAGEEDAAVDGGASFAPYYMETATLDRKRGYSPSSPTAEPWYDTRMLVYKTEKSWDFTILTDHLVSGADAALDVTVYGVTGWEQHNPDHHLIVKFNGSVIADETFDFNAAPAVTATLPDGRVVDGGNRLTFTLPGDTAAAYEIVSFDSARLTYPRAFVAQGDGLTFTAAGDAFRVTGLPGSDVTVYRQDGSGLTRLTGVTVEPDSTGYAARFAGTGNEATYLVSSQLLSAAITAQPAPADIVTGNADLLIIAHPDFIDGLQPLVEARQAEGYRVKVVDVEEVYRQFNFSLFDAEAIQRYIRFAANKLDVSYVLLVGGDTYDYRGYADPDAISFIPSLYAPTGELVRFAPVDPLYADLDGDRVPDLAIGRFPVRTQADLANLVAKTLFYPQADYGSSGLLAADRSESGNPFRTDSEAFIAGLGDAWTITRAYLDDEDVATTRDTILDTLNAGVALTSYVGHSSYSVWSFDRLLESADVAGLTNVGRPTVVTQWGCWNTYYVSPQTTMADAFLLSGEQGAAAVMGATTLTLSDSEAIYGETLMPYLTQGMTLGEAMLQAKQAMVAAGQGNRADVILGWTLLGDPTLAVATR